MNSIFSYSFCSCGGKTFFDHCLYSWIPLPWLTGPPMDAPSCPPLHVKGVIVSPNSLSTLADIALNSSMGNALQWSTTSEPQQSYHCTIWKPPSAPDSIWPAPILQSEKFQIPPILQSEEFQMPPIRPPKRKAAKKPTFQPSRKQRTLVPNPFWAAKTVKMESVDQQSGK